MLDIKTNDYDPDGDTISIQTVKAVSSGWVDWYEKSDPYDLNNKKNVSVKKN